MKSVFQIGLFKFSLSCADAQLAETVGNVFAPASEPTTPNENIDLEELSTNEDGQYLADPLDLLIDKIIDLSYAKHQGFIYLDAAVLVHPKGAASMIVGRSYSGKTTSALSLCLSKGWKLLSEDISYIEPTRGRFLTVVCPLSIRQPTWQLIETQLNIRRRSLVADRWLHCPDLFVKNIDLHLNQIENIFFLSSNASQNGIAFSTEQIQPVTALHQALPTSNLLRAPHTIPFFSANIENSRCFSIQGGNLKERVDFINATV
ncbi:MAG: hypothetical protein K2W82_14445 [Candidatus Obscuribacterales bacterium]|nr:hypothetical protein [Candidatus Obscuribacterales bacterium]